MITINSYIHRDLLKDIIMRWMYNDLHPSDTDAITRLVHFNSLYVSRYLQIFSDKVFGALHQTDLIKVGTTSKGELKDAIVKHCPCRNDRIDELIGGYERHPGRYFRETPCQAMLFFVNSRDIPLYVGSCRIKRIRRLAEKGARRIIDGIFDTIKKHADRLADERAMRIGISRALLITTPEEMLAEFLKAEDRLLEDLRFRRALQGLRELAIDDVAGIKVILENGAEGRLMTVLNGMEDCRVVEEERHMGNYNATNRIVRYRPPKEAILRQPLDTHLLELMKIKGRSPEQTAEDFAEFVRSGEEEVYLEVISSNYQEMLESEIGRCMHEDRIIEQRLQQQYRGHLAKNVEYLMRFLFLFPLSSQKTLEALPVKLWDRYLPDYFDGVISRLFQVTPYGVLE